MAAVAPFPVLRLLAATALAAGLSVLIPIGLKAGGYIDETVAKPLVLGLVAAAMSNVLGLVVGARVARFAASGSSGGEAVLLAYLAATAVRLLATPSLALSLYFLLPQKAAPLLLSAVAAHVLFMVVDIAALQRTHRRSAGPSAPKA
ncbi:MAG: hypothetical protein ACK5WD_07760 [bacterium]